MNFNPKYSRTLTDEIVEREVPKGGEFKIRRDQDSLTQGPGGVDLVSRVSGGVEYMTLVPRTDSVPQTEVPEANIWSRRR
jgi:hypothetical protein